MVGLLVLCIVTQTNPSITVKAYLAGSRLVLNQTESFAIHLSSLPWGSISSVFMWIITAGIIVASLWSRARHSSVHSEELTALTLISLYSFWSLLVLYHGRQDMVITLPFIAIVLFQLNTHNSLSDYSFSISKGERLLLCAMRASIFFVWIFPVYLVTGMDFYRPLYAICTIAAFAVSLRLLISIQKQTT